MATKTKAEGEQAPEEERGIPKDLDERDEAAAAAILQALEGRERQLHAKLADIMVIAERIPKRGTADKSMGGYKFVQVGDAADFIRKALGRRHVSMSPTTIEVLGRHDHATKSGGVMTILDMTIVWTLTDGDTGESTTIMSFGAGGDTGDKYSGKAMTSCLKYALLSGFQLSTGEDSELSDASDRVASSSERPQVTGTTGQRTAPAHGGRQQATTEPQSKVIGDLLRQLKARTSDAAISIIEELTGKKVEIGEDKAASLAAFVSGNALTANERGKLIHDLRKRVEGQQAGQQEAHDEAGDAAVERGDAEGGRSNPSAPAGEPLDEDLEAGSAL